MFETIFLGALSALSVFELLKHQISRWNLAHLEQPAAAPKNYFFKEDGYEANTEKAEKDSFGVSFLFFAVFSEEVWFSVGGRMRELTLAGRGFALYRREYRDYYRIKIVGTDAFDKGETFLGYDHKWDTEQMFEPVIRLSLSDYEYVLSKIQNAVDRFASGDQFIHLTLYYEKLAFEQRPFADVKPCYGVKSLSEIETYDLTQAVNLEIVASLQRRAAEGSAEERERCIHFLASMRLPIK